jgi:hypothetical protein
MGEDISGVPAARSEDSIPYDLDEMKKSQFVASAHLERVSVENLDMPTLDAPINWPAWKRNAQILMVAFHSMDSVFMAAGIIPGFEGMAEEYKISIPQASYLTSAMVRAPFILLI